MAALLESVQHSVGGVAHVRSLSMAKRLIVVGGGAGGPSAAAKAKRVDPDLEVTILESGEHVSFSA